MIEYPTMDPYEAIYESIIFSKSNFDLYVKDPSFFTSVFEECILNSVFILSIDQKTKKSLRRRSKLCRLMFTMDNDVFVRLYMELKIDLPSIIEFHMERSNLTPDEIIYTLSSFIANDLINEAKRVVIITHKTYIRYFYGKFKDQFVDIIYGSNLSNLVECATMLMTSHIQEFTISKPLIEKLIIQERYESIVGFSWMKNLNRWYPRKLLFDVISILSDDDSGVVRELLNIPLSPRMDAIVKLESSQAYK